MNEEQQPSAPTPLWATWLAGVLITLAALIAYRNSFSGPFIFDGEDAIIKNPSIRHLGSAWSPPNNGISTTGRPLANFSFGVNYALGGVSVWGYHALNLALHVFTALALFGLLRRTLLMPRLAGRFGGASLPLALSIALLWVVHPLATMTVTYVAQRSELLMGLFYLLTLYCFVRGIRSKFPGVWNGLAVLACLSGTISKEVMVSAPLAVLLYDRTFVAGTFREAWKQRGRFYLGLAMTWLVLLYLVVRATDRGGMIGAHAGVSWGAYLLTQSRVIIHYLQLSIWPEPLVFDYGRSVLARGLGDVLLYLVFVALLVAGTIASVRRRPALGFLGCCFFALLAPSSSVIPMPSELMAEHRMYLPLAAVMTLLVLVVYTQAGSKGYGMFLAVVVLFAAMTDRRNEDYQTAEAIWLDTVTKCPDSERAQYNYGNLLLKQGQVDAAISCYEKVLQLDPQSVNAHNNLGNALLYKGQADEAMDHFTAALTIAPNHVNAHNNLANALLYKGRVDEAINVLLQVIRLQPHDSEAEANLAGAFLQEGRWAEARIHGLAAHQSDPGNPYICNNLAWILAASPIALLRDGPEAVKLGSQADQQTGGRNCAMAQTLAAAYAEAGRFPEAVATAQRALQLATDGGQRERIQAQLKLYEAGQPFHEAVQTNAPQTFIMEERK